MLLEKTAAENLVADLMMGPLADGEPVDLVKYTRITPEAAAILARDFRGEERVAINLGQGGPKTVSCFELDLSGLKSLDVASARALARWNPKAEEPDEACCTLDLSGLRHSPPRVLAELAAWSVSSATACLVLDGFRALDPARATAIGRWSGGNLCSRLHLSRVAELSPESAAGLTVGYLDAIVLGLREIAVDTAVLLGQAGYGRIVLSALDGISPAALYALGGLTPDGQLRAEYDSPEFSRSEPLELFLNNAKPAPLRNLSVEMVEALDAVGQLGIKVHLSIATRRALRKIG